MKIRFAMYRPLPRIFPRFCKEAFMLRQELLKRKKTLENYIRTIETWLNKTPDKKMVVSTIHRKEKTVFRYYLYGERELSVKKDRSLITMLSNKTYFIRVLSSSKEELSAVNRLLNKTDLIASEINAVHPARKVFITPLEEPISEVIRKFEEESFPPSDYEITNPVDTLKGDKVRSWPESLIANSLFKEKIPYKYEKPFKLKNGHTVYPDFTIINPLSGELYLWEHFGRMDKPGYRTTTVRKIKDYAETGMMIGRNLIATFDDDEYKLSEKEILQLIAAYFK